MKPKKPIINIALLNSVVEEGVLDDKVIHLIKDCLSYCDQLECYVDFLQTKCVLDKLQTNKIIELKNELNAIKSRTLTNESDLNYKFGKPVENSYNPLATSSSRIQKSSGVWNKINLNFMFKTPKKKSRKNVLSHDNSL